MTMPSYDRPDSSEYAPFYADYIAAVPGDHVIQVLERQADDLARLIASVPQSRGDYRYAAGKWSLKEVIGHVADSERVFGYRALRIARADATPLSGFDEKTWVPQSGAKDRTLGDLVEELKAVRAATVALFRHLPAEAPTRRGTANNREVSVRALAWIAAGHALHHQRIIEERYLGG